MPENTNTPEQKTTPPQDPQFDEEMILEEAGFSFHPIIGFELEVNGSVYMYSDDGNLEISMIGGELDHDTTVAELNDQLAAEFMENFDEFSLIEAGKDTIQGITGFLNEIRFLNAEEEGLGRALICSPHINQFFFLLVISSAEYWEQIGCKVFSALKPHIHFHSQFKPVTIPTQDEDYPDLSIEVYEAITSDEDMVVSIEKEDISLLMAARTSILNDEIAITQIRAPGNQILYHYDPISGEFNSLIGNQPLISSNGEVCLFLPSPNQPSLEVGDYQFSFATKSGMALQETKIIIRHGKKLGLQKLDLNLWLALENERFNDQDYLIQFESKLRKALTEQLAPLNIVPGRIECFHPAPDELDTFACVNIDYDLADCSYMITESIENSRALNVALVERITQADPPVDASVNAVSTGSPGMILSPNSPHACILVNYSPFENDFSALAKTIIEHMLIFSGTMNHPVWINSQSIQPDEPLSMKPEMDLLRRHPIFYSKD
jgi:hypothetical protein